MVGQGGVHEFGEGMTVAPDAQKDGFGLLQLFVGKMGPAICRLEATDWTAYSSRASFLKKLPFWSESFCGCAFR
jgi:hypothetical protein